MNSGRLWIVLLVVAALAQACAPGEGTPASPLDTPPEVNNDAPIDDPPAPVECIDGEIHVSPSPVRLLTRAEYDNTVRDLLGVEAGLAVSEFPPENKVGSFENDAASHVVSPLLVNHFVTASEELADQMIPARMGELLPCDPATDGEMACGEAFLQDFLPRAFRRPVQGDELALFTRLFERALPLEGFEGTMRLMLQAALQSPQFLYRLEMAPGEEPPRGRPLEIDGYAMASRLSYFIWGSMPDQDLFDAAARGELSSPLQIEDQARRMMADPRASASIQSFYRQWLGLDVLESLIKDAETYPGYGTQIKEDWRVSLQAFIDHIYWDQEPTLEALLTDPTVYMTPELAALHGVAVEGPAELIEVEGGEAGPRAGLLTQPTLMAALANPDQGSPIRRGVFVRERVLCQILPPPPNDVLITPPDPDPSATTRERFAEHTANSQCADCHSLIDPLGFGFENYDGVGHFRDTENGLAVDATGEVTGVGRSTALAGPFDGAVELAGKLAGSELVEDCLAEQWFTYATGRMPRGLDRCALEDVQEGFRASGGDLRELMIAVVLSDAFRHRVAQGPAAIEEESP